MVDPASKFTELNCMRVGSPAANLPLPDLGRLEVMGYRVLSIRDLRVLNTDTDVNAPDPAWHLATIGQGTDILLSGTFTYDMRGLPARRRGGVDRRQHRARAQPGQR